MHASHVEYPNDAPAAVDCRRQTLCRTRQRRQEHQRPTTKTSRGSVCRRSSLADDATGVRDVECLALDGTALHATRRRPHERSQRDRGRRGDANDRTGAVDAVRTRPVPSRDRPRSLKPFDAVQRAACTSPFASTTSPAITPAADTARANVSVYELPTGWMSRKPPLSVCRNACHRLPSARTYMPTISSALFTSVGNTKVARGMGIVLKLPDRHTNPKDPPRMALAAPTIVRASLMPVASASTAPAGSPRSVRVDPIQSAGCGPPDDGVSMPATSPPAFRSRASPGPRSSTTKRTSSMLDPKVGSIASVVVARSRQATLRASSPSSDATLRFRTVPPSRMFVPVSDGRDAAVAQVCRQSWRRRLVTQSNIGRAGGGGNLSRWRRGVGAAAATSVGGLGGRVGTDLARVRRARPLFRCPATGRSHAEFPD